MDFLFFFLRRGFVAPSRSAVDGIIHSALPTTRRCRLQLLRVLYWKSLKRRAGLPLWRLSPCFTTRLNASLMCTSACRYQRCLLYHVTLPILFTTPTPKQ